ncbi:response regulator [Puniceibacterium sp. IMCC21224]|uniref:response regulator n=1 Tax=Puniceibacterium sp. IMCC21224 TaxID=1618204 RepID=UPI00064D94D3|nr:response regulator [Puniceibacterium sp. IMCC21224]KMK65932.1 signal transduction histidine kinase [Puniceibacterium sp. IMCC21224]
MDFAHKLAEERRARLAAERLLELKQAELFAANRKLGHHAKKLSHEITETRAEVANVRSENQQVKSELGQANQKIQVVESQLWKALASIRDGFALFNAEGLLEIANPAYLTVFDGLDTIGPGASHGHVVAMMVEEGIVDLQGETADVWSHRMLTRWDQRVIPSVTIRLWSGQFLKIQDRRTPDGGVVSLAIDMTDLMRMWSAVQEMPDGFVIYDSDDRLLMCNEPYRQFYTKTAPAMVPGAQFEDILRYALDHGQHVDAVGREAEWLEQRLKDHRSPVTQQEQQLEDGRWLRVFDKQTSDGGRVGLRVDITPMKEAQIALERATERAESANRAKSAFLANMSHEIRTPMNGVVGMADLLMEADLTEEQQLYVETIRNSGEALLVIINDVLDFSKIEAEKLILHPEPFDLERVVHEIVMLLQPTARDKGLDLLVDYDMFLPTRFIGDPGRLRQVLTNLLGNAVKFTIEGHVLIRVVGIPDDAGTAIHITVEDTGIGIPTDKTDHVFGEFNQVEDERNRQFEGTGLGLAITQRLIRLMGGDVWVESEFGKGTCFGFSLTLPPEHPVTFETANLPETIKTALVVDDHNTNRSILSKQLSILGVTTSYCATGADALDRVGALGQSGSLPDLLLIEQDLPDMTGLDLADRLRRLGVQSPALLFSNNPAMLQSLPGRDAVQAVLQKPMARRTLFAALSGLGARSDDTALPCAPEPVASQPTGTLRVLVAEDNKTNQLVFRKMVAALDLELTFANNGFEAVAAFKTARPDVIFMDISMPGMDGKQATCAIREIEGDGPRVPIIAVTAHAMSGDREVILEAGLDDYLTKPLRKTDLISKIERHGYINASAT